MSYYNSYSRLTLVLCDQEEPNSCIFDISCLVTPNTSYKLQYLLATSNRGLAALKLFYQQKFHTFFNKTFYVSALEIPYLMIFYDCICMSDPFFNLVTLVIKRLIDGGCQKHLPSQLIKTPSDMIFEYLDLMGLRNF